MTYPWKTFRSSI